MTTLFIEPNLVILAPNIRFPPNQILNYVIVIKSESLNVNASNFVVR